MYELLDQHIMFDSKCLDDFKNLQELVDRFEVRIVILYIGDYYDYLLLFLLKPIVTERVPFQFEG